MYSYAIPMALGTLALVAMAVCLAAAVAFSLPRGRTWVRTALGAYQHHVLAWAWVTAIIAMAGSLYLSDVMKLPPCLLCWYQRIAMYPLVLILGVGVVRQDSSVWRFALPLPLVGAAISAYHVLLQYQPNLEVIACTGGVPCTARLLAIHGFVSIPVMAGSAFVLIAVFLMTVRFLEADSAEPGAAGQSTTG